MESKNRQYNIFILSLFLALFNSNILQAETPLQMREQYIILLKDKANSPFEITKPEEFLSLRSIERKKKLGIPITEEDLPVNMEYKNQIAQLPGVQFLFASRWFNSITIDLDTNTTKPQEILRFPFVKDIEHIGRTPIPTKEVSDSVSQKDELEIFNEKVENLRLSYKTSRKLSTSEYYGSGFEQIEMLSGHRVHQLGYKGKGVLIAVLDVGFQNVNRLPAFDSLFANKQIISYTDFVEFDSTVWNSGSHGTNSLSCIAANIPGVFVGTAPEANFVLIKTENDNYESRLEESNWLAGAEYSDSIGADIISSSLGYTTFKDKEFSHTYSDMDGKSTLITRAANKAFEKGMIVMNSAGNEGFDPWHYIGAPADGINVVASGGVDIYMYPSVFSSFGPSFDGRIKPNISALATNTIVAESNAEIGPSNGTSFSNPILAGMMACLIQACPDKSLDEIVQAVYKSGSHYAFPDERYGYGVPDFAMSLAILGKIKGFDLSQNFVFENELKKGYALATLRVYSAFDQKVTFSLKRMNESGKYKKITKTKVKLNEGDFYSTPWLINYLQKHGLKNGNYLIEIESKYMMYRRTLTIGG
ncbi:MAG: S8 family serine peptidase [Bacteroidetes bacterium]|nr:S8 family serine peptidase [Bacteroidota bacterium]